MQGIIERAKSGRAKCRKCKEKIDKDELRFGNVIDAEFESYQWYHMACAAEKVPVNFGAVLDKFDEEEVPDRATLEETIAKNRKKQKPTQLPYAESAPSARSTCLVCEEKIAKGEVRVAVEKEIDTGSFSRTGAGYLHPKCAPDYDDAPEDFIDQVAENSLAFEPEELNEILEQLTD